MILKWSLRKEECQILGTHDRKVIAVGFVANDGFKKVYVLEQNSDKRNGNTASLIPEAEICQTEKDLLQKTFNTIRILSDHSNL